MRTFIRHAKGILECAVIIASTAGIALGVAVFVWSMP
jgi:hypothetical protein